MSGLPKHISPASPSPGTMYPLLLTSPSMAQVYISRSGLEFSTFFIPSSDAMTFNRTSLFGVP